MNRTLVFQIVRFLFVIACTILGLYVALFISKLTYPFIIALIIAYLLNPLVNFLNEKARVPRGIAAFLSIILLLAILAGLFTLLITEIISGSTYLIQVVPESFERLIYFVENLVTDKVIPLYDLIMSKYSQLGAGQQHTIRTNIQSIGDSAINLGKEALNGIIVGIKLVIALLPNTATLIFVSLLATFFISKDWYKIKNLFAKYTPDRIQHYSKTIFIDLRKALFGFIKAHITLISMTTVLVLIGLLILRVPFAITIAILIGFIDLLPYLGTGLIFIPWILYTFLSSDYKLTIGLAILYGVVIVQRQLAEPKVLSSNIGLQPLPTLISIFVGFKFFGLLGLIAGPVTLVILSTLYRARVFHELWYYIRGSN
ncbi:sporulation integral membrane protein YtvI [Gottfriedia luciferensis]|uniref:Sporulation integral membrane protein YtvI n=1 Tax=Gottfriedia luciferensis TaxID=178774 RepID=A0ABX2ZPU5_9BACI|nr:sporulation integral membrane protein YtvI [Gottfriedia luciferensis]ODG90730.1 sporulation integral membrane protein YtvI [Gottfriedia luciferensis]